MLDKGTLYGYRVHPRDTEDDPHLATLMYAYNWEGPWHDMVTGDPGYIDEVLTAVYQLNESAGWRDKVAELEAEVAELKDRIHWLNEDLLRANDKLRLARG